MNFTLKNSTLIKALGAAGLATVLALPVQADNTLKNKSDGSWVSLSGKVVSHTPKAFTLDYGEGTIKVETDDWDNIGDGWAINEGDNVTVYGKVDNGFYHSKKIEAGSVYVEDLNTLVTAPSAADEEKIVSYTYFTVPATHDLQVAGTVTSVSDRMFTLDTGERKVEVDTIELGYNPMDNIGYPKIEKGDFVSVSGELDTNLFTKNEITAQNIIKYY